jgi:SAM-dependent methyltransferase
MSSRQFIKSLLRSISWRPLDVFLARRHQRRWLDKQDQGQLHVGYFADYRSRLPVAEAIAQITLHGKIVQPHIFEFGCSGGNNLRLLREVLPYPIKFTGIDIQEDAIAFAKSHFPEDTFVQTAGNDHEALEKLVGKVDIFLISGVLTYFPQKEAGDLFTLAHRISSYLVVCDVTERFYETKGVNDGLFLHPYKRMIEEAGFRILTPPPDNPADRFAVFTAEAL